MRQRRKTRLSTYFLPGNIIRKIAFTISSFSVELTLSPDYQSVSFPATERSWTLPSESLHSPSSPKRRFGRECSCCLSFLWEAWNASLGLRRDNGKKTSGSGIPCTSHPSKLDVRSTSLSLPIGGHALDDSSIFHLQHHSPLTKHLDQPEL